MLWCLVNLARNQNSSEINLFIISKQTFIFICMCVHISWEHDIKQSNATLPFLGLQSKRVHLFHKKIRKLHGWQMSSWLDCGHQPFFLSFKLNDKCDAYNSFLFVFCWKGIACAYRAATSQNSCDIFFLFHVTGHSKLFYYLQKAEQCRRIREKCPFKRNINGLNSLRRNDLWLVCA